MIQIALAFFGLTAMFIALSLAYSAVYVRGAWVQWRAHG